MAKRKSSVTQKSKTAVKTTGKVVAAGYAYRLAVTGGAAKRVAQKNAVRSDLKRVSRVSKRVANTPAGKKVRSTKAVSKAETTGRASVAKTKAFAGRGPVDAARNTQKLVKRSGGKAASHVGKNKGKYVAGAAVGVAAGAAATYAYKRHKAKPKSKSSATTYKRRTASGKIITVRKGKTRKQVGNAFVHYSAYGSTRYTSKGAKNSSRAKGVGSVYVGSMAGAFAGAAIGTKVGGLAGYHAGSFIGSLAGSTTGRAVARERGYIVRTKKRATVRAVNKAKGKMKGGKR